MGLSNIRSRVSSLKGKFTITSRPGEGMSVKVAVAVNGADITLEDSPLEPMQKPKRKRKHGRKDN
jgi:signal transduction histidine kinase